jgi:UDPglucose--hexose-1-phosphate uridylyltransferase
MPEFRQNPINKHWVIIAKERAKRPNDFKEDHKPEPIDPSKNPFALGNEAMTPPESLVYSDKVDREPNTPDWTVRVFPNKFPILDGKGEFEVNRSGVYSWAPGLGFHEVVATNDPNKPLSHLPKRDVMLVLKAYKERIKHFASHRFVRYTLPIYNHGKAAGASLAHPHSQLFAIPLVSNYILLELEKELEYYNEISGCGSCGMIAQEIAAKERIVLENDRFVSFAPYASREPFEVVIYPKQHEHQFEKTSDDDLMKMAEVLKGSLRKLHDGLGNPNYNYYLHTSPHDGNDYSYSHWHLKILPRLSVRAGFELGTGIIVNTMPPEHAAEFLRSVEVDLND